MLYIPHFSWPSTLILTTLLTRTLCTFNASLTYPDLTTAFPQLTNWNAPPHTPPSLGGRNLTKCCARAVFESFQLINGSVQYSPNNFIAGPLSIAEFGDAQFPCGAKYSDTYNKGAPSVRVPYSWCKSNCGGWVKSEASSLSQWVQAFVGFILPSIVFCLNVSFLFLF
jgi:hypothetical protein